MKPCLYIRADADAAIGTGHVMRCLALGEEWQRSVGGPVTFLGRIDSDWLKERLRKEGFSHVPMPAAHPDRADAALVEELMARGGENPECWLVLDGYHLDASYQEKVRRGSHRVLVVDDNAHLPAYHGDILLNQNIHAAELTYPAAEGMRRLLGPRYALLRGEFRQPIARNPDPPPQARKLLVTLGGADPANATARILACLAALRISDLEVKALIGSANPHFADIAELVQRLALGCTLVPATRDMAALMRWAEAAVTAAGATVYELAACGVPMAAVIIAENQEHNAVNMAARGVATHLGRLEAVSDSRLAAELYDFIHDHQKRREQSRAGRTLVDGRGAERVVAAMRGEAFSLRPARWEDRDVLLKWANEPGTRQNSFHSRPIPRKDHEAWLSKRLEDGNCRMYIAMESQENPIGVVRFDLAGETAVISVSLDKAFRGRGLGSRIIAAACDRLLAEKPTLVIEARIRGENLVSRQAFAKAGFFPVGRTVQNHIPALRLCFNARGGSA